MNSLLGDIQIIENSVCERLVPSRPHIKQRTQSEAYHRRIDKKWLKRYGRKVEHVAYFFQDPLTGQQFTALGPRAIAMLRNLK